MACLPQLGSVPAAYAVVAGGCDGLSNNMTSLRYVPYVACVGWIPRLSDAKPEVLQLELPKANKKAQLTQRERATAVHV